MREFITLIEGVLVEDRMIKLTNEHDRDFYAIANPTPEQRKNLIRKAPYNEVKGLLSPDGKTVYIWAADFAHHGHAFGLLHGMTNDEMLVNGPDEDMLFHPEFLSWESFFVGNDQVATDGRGAERLAASPTIRRMFTGPFKVYSVIGKPIEVANA